MEKGYSALEPFPVKSTPILLLLLIFRGILYGGESVIGKGNGMTQQAMKKKNNVQAKPILKWAGGKTQMLGNLLPKVPATYNRYI